MTHPASMTYQELHDWLRLMLTPGIGNVTARQLLAAFGLPEAVFRQSAAALQQVVSRAQAQALGQTPADLERLLARTWHWLQEAATDAGVQRRVLTWGDASYPAHLLHVDEPPMLLYVMGQHLPTARPWWPSIAVVGSRNPTAQGALNAHAFAKALAQARLCVVSGLALGVDAAAHEGALAGFALAGEPSFCATIAVVGTGLDRVYPKSHLDLARRIVQSGCLVSEYPLGTPPLAANFPKRNRLIAGLSQATLVVEAALQSGSLITARLANDQGKDVFAIPGSIHAPQSRGCHLLIKQGAKLVEAAQDVLEEFQHSGFLSAPSPNSPNSPDGTDSPTSPVARPSLAASLAPPPWVDVGAATPSAATLLQDALGFDPVELDALQLRTGLDTAQLMAQLMALELEGLVARLPGGRFQRLSAP